VQAISRPEAVTGFGAALSKAERVIKRLINNAEHS